MIKNFTYAVTAQPNSKETSEDQYTSQTYAARVKAPGDEC